MINFKDNCQLTQPCPIVQFYSVLRNIERGPIHCYLLMADFVSAACYVTMLFYLILENTKPGLAPSVLYLQNDLEWVFAMTMPTMV